MHPPAYGKGARAAVDNYGAHALRDIGRMPDGPPHLGASRFAKALEEQPETPHATGRKQNRLERDVVWGPEASPESGGISNNDSALTNRGV